MLCVLVGYPITIRKFSGRKSYGLKLFSINYFQSAFRHFVEKSANFIQWIKTISFLLRSNFFYASHFFLSLFSCMVWVQQMSECSHSRICCAQSIQGLTASRPKEENKERLFDLFLGTWYHVRKPRENIHILHWHRKQLQVKWFIMYVGLKSHIHNIHSSNARNVGWKTTYIVPTYIGNRLTFSSATGLWRLCMMKHGFLKNYFLTHIRG